MAGPDKKKGKGKEKVVEDQELMEEIPAKLETILNQQAEKENTKFEKIAGKLCTPPKGGGTFLVRLVPRRESNFDEPVYLLFRWKDLYFEAFYSRGKWYRLKDHEEKLPPRSQLPYSEKPDEGIYVLMNTTSYGSIGGSSVVLGPRAWDHCHVSFLKADDLVRQSNKKPLTSGESPALAVPVVGISEPLRFPQLQKWIVENCTATASSDVMVPYEFTKHFTNWGDLSTALFSGKLTEKLKAYTLEQMAEMLGILMSGKREAVRSPPKKKNDHEAGSSRNRGKRKDN
ncbi:hypothetical protein OsJ_25952 [Oryza sativa Japonica Group]|uniref:Uncharacterized protein n=2 Tax=Oryza sativa subsp. japonica TaxID=39947 RepID=A3BPE1_ORYSJ|nr:hypothetical protein OsJ_25952 [Oryza sativa Japonica Group]